MFSVDLQTVAVCDVFQTSSTAQTHVCLSGFVIVAVCHIVRDTKRCFDTQYEQPECPDWVAFINHPNVDMPENGFELAV